MRVAELLPEVYYKESRDFAYVGRLLELLFNYMKTGADCVNAEVDNSEDVLVDLLVDTLGFDLRHEYINKDLITIASAFSSLLKLKGTIEGLNLVVRLLLNSQGISTDADFDFCNFDSVAQEVEVFIPDSLTDLILLEDLFDYFLPAGIIYKFTKFSNSSNNKVTSIYTDSYNDYAGCSAGSFRAHDDDLGIVKSEPGVDTDNSGNVQVSHLGNFYTGVVVTSMEHLSDVDTGGDIISDSTLNNIE